MAMMHSTDWYRLAELDGSRNFTDADIRFLRQLQLAVGLRFRIIDKTLDRSNDGMLVIDWSSTVDPTDLEALS